MLAAIRVCVWPIAHRIVRNPRVAPTTCLEIESMFPGWASRPLRRRGDVASPSERSACRNARGRTVHVHRAAHLERGLQPRRGSHGHEEREQETETANARHEWVLRAASLALTNGPEVPLRNCRSAPCAENLQANSECSRSRSRTPAVWRGGGGSGAEIEARRSGCASGRAEPRGHRGVGCRAHGMHACMPCVGCRGASSGEGCAATRRAWLQGWMGRVGASAMRKPFFALGKSGLKPRAPLLVAKLKSR